MRERLAPAYGIVAEGKYWPRFVNNHAWALVRLQAEGTIRKLGPGLYALAAAKSGSLKPPQPTPSIEPDVPLPGWARRMIAVANAKNLRRWNGEPFMEDDLRALWLAGDGHCALTGLPFFETQVGTGRARKPYAPSLDRIDPEKPYVRDNCRLVRVCVNFALNTFGDEVFEEMTEAAVAFKRSERFR